MPTAVTPPLKPFWQHSDLGVLRQLILVRSGTGAGVGAAARIAMCMHRLPPEKIVVLRTSEAVLIPACV